MNKHKEVDIYTFKFGDVYDVNVIWAYRKVKMVYHQELEVENQ